MKKCKGINKAKGYGCGELVERRKYGLCFEHKCFPKWLYGTDEGKETLNRHTIKAKKETKQKERLQDQKKKIDLMSLSKVKSTMIQPKINELVRIIDNGQPCIATGNFGKMNAGHFYHAGGSSQIRFNLHNIHIQSFESNHFKSGDAMNYIQGIKRIYGDSYLEFMEGLKQTPSDKHTKQFYLELNTKLSAIKKWLKSEINGQMQDIGNRIRLRNQVNILLGLYENKYAVFKQNKE